MIARVLLGLLLCLGVPTLAWTQANYLPSVLFSYAQRAYDDTNTWFFFNGGSGSGIYTSIGPTQSTQVYTVPVSAVTNANPAVVTTTSPHGYVSGQVVWFTGALGMTQLNSKPFTITVIDATDFSLGVDSTTWGAYTSGATGSSIFSLYPTEAAGAGSDALWSNAQSANVAYSWWKASGSTDAQAHLVSYWNYVKARYPLVQLQQCQTYGTAAAQDDAAWAATSLVQMYEATGDNVALQYAKGMIDCAWARWGSSDIGGGLWYEDTYIHKNTYQVQFALANYLYYQDSGDTTYLTYAQTLEAWIDNALLRNGQTVVAQNLLHAVFTGTATPGTYAAGDTVSETFTCSCVSGSPVTVTYTLNNTDTAPSTAAGVAALINGNTALTLAGISSFSFGQVVGGATQSINYPAADSALVVTSAVTPAAPAGPTIAISTVGPGAGTWVYPSDGLIWNTVSPNNNQPYGVVEGAKTPYQIAEGSSETMVEANMAYAALEALFYNATGNAAYKTRLNQAATSMRTYEVVTGTNIFLNDQDPNVDGFAAYYYASLVPPLLTGAAGTQADKTTLIATAWSAATNDRCSNGTYGGSWEGPCQGRWFTLGQSASNFYNVVSSQAANLIIAGYYAATH